jgi:hypothetical protein
MAGISQKVTPEELLPLLSRNVFTEGYERTDHPTEFLILLRRYVVQARELSALSAQSGMVIRVTNCDDARPLMRILGYRTRGDCGQPQTTLLTEDPERAFLAIDSGFPLPALEETLQGGKPFEYAYTSSSAPVIFAESDWTKASKKNYVELSKDLLDTLLNDPAVARLYWALSRLDPATQTFLQNSIGIGKLLPYAAVLDFYGREICVSGGKVRVPGGANAEAAWKDLVGASPASPAAFVTKLLAKDKGWLAAYFDVLSRATQSQQQYFTDSRRLRFFYSSLRAPDAAGGAIRGAFRPAPGMLLLATRLRLDESGGPLIPGGIKVWQDFLAQTHNANLVRRWARQDRKLGAPDDLIQTMFALSRAPTESGPLQIFMMISELDGRRAPQHRLSSATVSLLAHKFEDFSDQYRMFSEFPQLDDDSIAHFLEVTQALNRVPMAYRGNAFGILQANIGIWQILARQGEIPEAHLNDSWQRVISPFSGIHSEAQVFDAGRTSLGELFRFSTGKVHGSQDEIIELLAGPAQKTPEGMQMHREVANRIRSVLDDQRLVSLDTLLAVGEGLAEKAKGNHPQEFVATLASQTREFEMPRPIFTSSEHSQWAAGVYNNHHTDMEMHSDLPKVLKSPTVSRAQVDDARGQLASFLRDTLVGLNYAYYEPPGAQALHNNPLFVRSHDFAGESIGGMKTLWQAPELIGQGTPAGGGAHFVGSLADLPYALASLEEDFIAPASVQALVWAEVTPELLTSATIPRWWDINPLELHAVALYQKAGEELLLASANDEALRGKVLEVLSDRLLPLPLSRVQRELEAGHAEALVPRMMPADTFYLAAEFERKYPDDNGAVGSAIQELQELSRQHPEQVSWKRLSHDFGTPHPRMAQNYGLELLNIAPMPPFAGESNRFLAESWDSPNLYWARLADEAGYSPVMLNRLVPQLMLAMVEKIFATDFEDWPALLRAMRETGTEFKEGKLSAPSRLSSAR